MAIASGERRQKTESEQQVKKPSHPFSSEDGANRGISI
jgi:hypothetical protein